MVAPAAPQRLMEQPKLSPQRLSLKWDQKRFQNYDRKCKSCGNHSELCASGSCSRLSLCAPRSQSAVSRQSPHRAHQPPAGQGVPVLNQKREIQAGHGEAAFPTEGGESVALGSLGWDRTFGLVVSAQISS